MWRSGVELHRRYRTWTYGQNGKGFDALAAFGAGASIAGWQVARCLGCEADYAYGIAWVCAVVVPFIALEAYAAATFSGKRMEARSRALTVLFLGAVASAGLFAIADVVPT